MDGSGFSEDPDAEAKLLGGGLTTSSSSFLSLDNGVQGVQYELRTSCSSLSKSFSTAHSSAALRFRRPDSLEASLKHGIGQAMGARDRQEDAAKVVPFSETKLSRAEPTEPCVAIYSVFDGHGGVAVADFLRASLPGALTITSEWAAGDIEGAIRKACMEIDKQVWSDAVEEMRRSLLSSQILDSPTIPPDCGSTATMAVFHGNQLYLANVGDGEAVLCRNGEALRISTLHRYTNSEERLRVENAGGIFVNGSLAHPVWNAQLINIQLTRSFGDAYFKLSKYVKDANSGLIAEPSIQRVVLKSYDEFVLMATDGYWDVVKPATAVVFVHNMLQRQKDPEEICAELTQMALVERAHDNVTVMLITLRELSAEGASVGKRRRVDE